jgi:hypothetical protein
MRYALEQELTTLDQDETERAAERRRAILTICQSYPPEGRFVALMCGVPAPPTLDTGPAGIKLGPDGVAVSLHVGAIEKHGVSGEASVNVGVTGGFYDDAMATFATGKMTVTYSPEVGAGFDLLTAEFGMVRRTSPAGQFVDTPCGSLTSPHYGLHGTSCPDSK